MFKLFPKFTLLAFILIECGCCAGDLRSSICEGMIKFWCGCNLRISHSYVTTEATPGEQQPPRIIRQVNDSFIVDLTVPTLGIMVSSKEKED